MKLKDKVAIVTGASRGIGKAIALDFAREGAMVVVAARTEVEGKLSGTIHNTVKEIESFGGKALALKCDVTSEKEVENMVRRALDQFGGISVLVNNAAVGYYKTLLETPLKHWDLIMKVNVGGPFICIKAVLPTMIEKSRGSIINLSSSAAEEVFSRIEKKGGNRNIVGTAYGASKVALERLTRGLAEEVRDHNIAVNALKPNLPTYSEGIVFWNPDVDPSSFISPHLYMTKAAMFLAQQDSNAITGRIFYDQDLCKKHNLT